MILSNRVCLRCPGASAARRVPVPRRNAASPPLSGTAAGIERFRQGRPGVGPGHCRPTAAAAAAQQQQQLSQCVESTTIYVRAGELQRSLLLEVLPEGKSLAVVVVGVLEGSEADQAGIAPGQRLLAISDPIRPDQMWPLGASPSLRYVKDTLAMMRNKEVGLQLCTKPLYTAAAEAAVDAGSIDEDSLNLVSNIRPSSGDEDGSSSGPGETTLGERLAQRYTEAQSVKQQQTSEVQKRIQARKAYMDVVSKRNDSNVFVWVFALFLGPAVVILAVAYGTGYLDSMYINSLSTLK